MLTINSINRIEIRSGERMRAKDLGGIRAMLESSETLWMQENLRRKACSDRVRYSYIDLIMVLLWMEVKKTTFGGVVTDLTDCGGQQKLAALGLPTDANGRRLCPSASTLCDFRKNVLSTFTDELRQEVTRAYLDSLLEPRFCTCDSTPLESSRYSRRCDYSPHYEIRMDKLHIIMVNGMPIDFRHTGGNCGDNPQLLDMLREMEGESPRLYGAFLTDGGYHSFDTYVAVLDKTGKVMSTNQGKDAVFHQDATWDRIILRYNRLWRREGFRPACQATPLEILRFMIRNGEGDIVGRFLHNLDFRRGRAVKTALALKRHLCETVHFDAKRWIRLDVRGVHEKSVSSVIAMRFIAIQLLSLSFVSFDC